MSLWNTMQVPDSWRNKTNPMKRQRWALFCKRPVWRLKPSWPPKRMPESAMLMHPAVLAQTRPGGCPTWEYQHERKDVCSVGVLTRRTIDQVGHSTSLGVGWVKGRGGVSELSIRSEKKWSFLTRGTNKSCWVENSLGVPWKFKHRVTIWPSNSTLRYLPKITEKGSLDPCT